MQTPEKRVIVITGGSSGMGRAMVERFAQNGDHVVAIGRDEKKLWEIERALSDSVTCLQIDLSKRKEIEDAVASIVKRFPHIDVLINAAGFSGDTIRSDMPLEEAERAWDTLMDTNLKGSFLMTVAVAPHLRRPGGRIIYISSIAAFTGGSRAGSTGYSASKAGVIGLTYGFARELSEQGITVNAIAPGFIANTGFTGSWPEERVKGIVSQTPVGRAGQGNDIAAAALYLASPEASFVTGEVLNVNGGWLFGR
jgi:3-oxoacyl-[acyl-carrier protein] reductase